MFRRLAGEAHVHERQGARLGDDTTAVSTEAAVSGERAVSSEAARAVAIGAPIPGGAFRTVLGRVLGDRGFRALGEDAADPAALAVRVAGPRDGAGWLIFESEALIARAEDIARDIAARLGAPATVCAAQNGPAGVFLRLSCVEPDGTTTRDEHPAERDDHLHALEPLQRCEVLAVRAATDGESGTAGAGDRVLFRAAMKASTGNRRLDDIVRAIQAGATYSFEDRPDGRVTVRIDRGGAAGRQISMLTGDEARALKHALA